MRPLLVLTSALALATRCAARPYSEWLASSFIVRNATITRHYDPVVLYDGIARAAVHVGNDTLLRAADAAVSSLVTDAGVLVGWDPEYYSLDDIRIGNYILWLYRRTNETRYRVVADALRRQLGRWPRTPRGGFWHRAPIYEEHTRNRTSNLLVHGYDEARDALPAYGRLLGYFSALADGLERSQDEGGGWWLIMNEGYEAREGNYIESSATAMFAYGLLRGVRDGLLEERYRGVGLRAYDLLTSRFIRHDKDGNISFLGTVQVGSLNSNAIFEYYTSIPVVENDARGGGAFLFAAIEAEQV
ncbi:Six-hairpin glycosidase [Colletotrichum somersetense]|nr:Six-hairpin glycosidase [Colletotrichum somersetense]